MKTHIVYVPGLGDGYGWFRSLALYPWIFWGVKTSHARIDWYDGGSMESKLAKIRQAIDGVPAGRRIVLIGESAGATLALRTAVVDPRVKRVITLCGVARRTTPISQSIRRRAPALDEAMDTIGGNGAREIICVRAAADPVVGKRYSVIPGAEEHVIWSVGHLLTIVLCLTLVSPYMAYLAKK